MATISLESMDIPLFCWLASGTGPGAEARPTGLCGTPGCDFERVAICRDHIKHRPGVDSRIAVHQRVPRSAAVAHARATRALVYPVFEACRLPRIHVRHLPGRVLRAVHVDAVTAESRNRRRDDCLHTKRLAYPGRECRAESRDTEHQQVEGARQQLDDHKPQTQDRPENVFVHGPNLESLADGRNRTRKGTHRPARASAAGAAG